MKKIVSITIMVFLLTIALVLASSFQTKVELDISSISGISQLDNSDGNSVSVRIQEPDGTLVVERNAGAGVYKPNMSITMVGDEFSLDYDTDYVYNLSTTYGDFVYNFTTPAEPAAGAQLKSIQTVNFHLDQNVDTVKDMPINAVDLNKTYLICAGAKQNAGTETMWMWTWNVKILNDTTVRVYRSRGDYSTLDLTAHVVEFESGIKSVQRGDFTLNAGESSGILTINPIDTNKYFINNLGMRRGNDYLRYASNYDVRITLENSTAVKFERSGTTYQIITSYEIVEFE